MQNYISVLLHPLTKPLCSPKKLSCLHNFCNGINMRWEGKLYFNAFVSKWKVAIHLWENAKGFASKSNILAREHKSFESKCKIIEISFFPPIFQLTCTLLYILVRLYCLKIFQSLYSISLNVLCYMHGRVSTCSHIIMNTNNTTYMET